MADDDHRGDGGSVTDTRETRPYGSWSSPISVEAVIAGGVSLREARLDGDTAYWLEGRPAEGGRGVIVRAGPGEAPVDVTPPGFDARTRAHEYGGGAYAVAGGLVVFSRYTDGRVYVQREGEEPSPLTRDAPLRFADLLIDARRGRVIAVSEDHSGVHAGTDTEPRAQLVSIDLGSGAQTTLVEGADFYATPRLSPDGGRLAYLTWAHPDMPWDASLLHVSELDDAGLPTTSRVVAGGERESVVQPEWTDDGSLVFVSDRSGWWNPCLLPPDGSAVRPLAKVEAEFAGPQWVFGLSWYATMPDGSLLAIVRRAGRDALVRLALDGSRMVEIETPFVAMQSLRASGGRAILVGARADRPSAVASVGPDGSVAILRTASDAPVDPRFISLPEPITFPTAGGEQAHALFYRPTNPDFRGPEGERPPLVVMSHGGPTSAAGPGLDLEKQLFTSRGLAVVDVDYGGSTGYGRAYRERLEGRWGEVDVDDCVAAAISLAERDEVDARRMAITGGSAGGFTTLAALVFRDVFAAGVSHYGVGDLEALARDTHKFESRYLDRLVAPYPEGVELYRERSPIHRVERISCPVLVTQGLDDEVVPPAQAEALVRALDARRLPHAYLAFEGEGHGFRRAENIARALEAELSFYAQVFGFELADPIVPIELAHAERLRGA